MEPAIGRARYHFALIGLHWITLLLIALAFATGELREIFEDGPAERLLEHWHTVVGVTVLLATVLRLAVRAIIRTPAIVPPPPRWQATGATAVHVALYGLMIVLPLTGWLMLNADGETVTWFGLQLPTVIGPSERLEDVFEDAHEILVTAGYALIGVHAAAALFHHYVVGDNTLRRMWPAPRIRTG